jgi:hypothetical protein
VSSRGVFLSLIHGFFRGKNMAFQTQKNAHFPVWETSLFGYFFVGKPANIP